MLPPQLKDFGTVYNTACLAMMSVALEGLIDVCVALGLKRQDTVDVVIGGFAGLSVMLFNNTHPAVISESAALSKGCGL